METVSGRTMGGVPEHGFQREMVQKGGLWIWLIEKLIWIRLTVMLKKAVAGVSAVSCGSGYAAHPAVTSSAHASFDIDTERHQEVTVLDWPFTMAVDVPSGGLTSSKCHSPLAAVGGISFSDRGPFPVNVQRNHQVTASDNSFTVHAGPPPGISQVYVCGFTMMLWCLTFPNQPTACVFCGPGKLNCYYICIIDVVHSV